MTFAHSGFTVQTDTNQDQRCEPAGRASVITNLCTATSSPTTVSTTLTLDLSSCTSSTFCNVSKCNNLGCTSISCVQTNSGFNCLTNNGVQLTSCNPPPSPSSRLSCTRGYYAMLLWATQHS
jgi:hypothetical protein